MQIQPLQVNARWINVQCVLYGSLISFLLNGQICLFQFPLSRSVRHTKESD